MKNIIASQDNLIIMQFVPIALILVYFSYPSTFKQVSRGILGKLFAAMLVLYFTRQHFVFGTLACLMVIAYYNFLDDVETFDETKEEDKEEVEVEDKEDKEDKEVEEEEPFTLLQDDAKPAPSIITIDNFNTVRDEFIKEKCKNGVLMYKDFPVKSEMADHVYSEIKFNSKTKCNPCDRTCDYNIVEAKLKTQESLVPKSSNDLFDAVKSIFVSDGRV
jgi:hypothetical protein